MEMKPMKTLTIGDNIYEIIDEVARNGVNELQQEMTIIETLQSDVDTVKTDIETVKSATITPDTTLEKSGAAADAKAVGDAINQLNDDVAQLNNDTTQLRNDLTQEISDAISEITPENIGAVNVENVANNLTTVTDGYILDARQGYELNSLIQKRATTASYIATFPASGWSSTSPYTQTVNVDGILLTDDPIVDIDMSSATTSDDWALLTETWNFVGRITANEGSVTMYCYEDVPTVNITIYLKVVR